MEEQRDLLGMLDLMIRPGFCVKESKIVKVNQGAESYFLAPGMDVEALLLTGKSEYREFAGGCLYLTLTLSGKALGASVTRMQDVDVFLIEQDSDNQELRSMALAARELRDPLSNVMASANSIFSPGALQKDDKSRNQLARMNRSLFQMMRILGNMSDADRYAVVSRQETIAIREELGEIFRKAQSLISHTGIRLDYTPLQESIYCLADKEQLERAVLNMLSNAVKFTPEGGTIEASVTRNSHILRLSIQDSGEGIAENVRASVFHRYLRQLSIEDNRFGIGLGMVLIRCTAAHHGGTVLIDHPAEKGTRITMTMEIRQHPGNLLRSPMSRVDYAGGYDHALLELSESLPASVYEKEV